MSDETLPETPADETPVQGDAPAPLPPTPEEMARSAAEADHAAFCAKMAGLGWSYGPKKDFNRKLMPRLCAYADLPAEVRTRLEASFLVGLAARFAPPPSTEPAAEAAPVETVEMAAGEGEPDAHAVEQQPAAHAIPARRSRRH